MTLLVTDDVGGQSVEATGHPTECSETVSGSVQGTSHSVTITDASGNSAPIATKLSTLHFDSHAHDYDSINGCHDNQSHDISDADLDSAKVSSSITINGEPVLVVADDVATDPGSNGAVNITDSGINKSLTELP